MSEQRSPRQERTDRLYDRLTAPIPPADVDGRPAGVAGCACRFDTGPGPWHATGCPQREVVR